MSTKWQRWGRQKIKENQTKTPPKNTKGEVS
jgi:hypothetical protein